MKVVKHLSSKKNLDKIIEELRNLALSYIEKYSSSKQQLRIYLLKKISKKTQINIDKKQFLNLIDSVIESLEKKNFVNDQLYSNSKAKKFLKKGYSVNKIRYSLLKKGIDDKFIKSTISDIYKNELEQDFFSAIKYCKIKRIGPTRNTDNRKLFYKKDIGILARSGFSYEVSKKVLDISEKEFIILCKTL